MNHFPFIIASYAVFALLLFADGIAPWLARRSLVRELGNRLKREAARGRAGSGKPEEPESMP